MKWRRWLGRILAVVLAVGLLACGALAFLGWQMYRQALEEKPLEQAIEEIRAKPNYTTLDELPRIYLDAVVAVEDQRFYSHPGFDLLAMGRALWNDLRAGSFLEGGSTITQQLAKNLYFSQEKRLVRKAAEIWMALDLERTCSKDEILELYLNSIYFGAGCYCVYDASMAYFGKAPSEMDASEATLLAGIPNAPSVYAPSENPDLAVQRQRQVLQRMVGCGYLTWEEAGGLIWAG